MNRPEPEFDDELVANDLPTGFARESLLVDRPGEADNVLLVDVSNLAYRSAFAYQELTLPGTDKPSGHVYGSLRLLQATLKNHVPAGRWSFAFAYDGVGATAARQRVLPSYKADRVHKFDPKPDVKEVLSNVPGLHIEAPELEGDDAIAWAAHKLSHKQVVVLSGDKDLWALLELPHVQVFSPNLNRYVTHQDIEKKYHVSEPERIYMAKALFGDSSDGVKGWSACRKEKGVEGCATKQHAQVAPLLLDPATGSLGVFYAALAAAHAAGTVTPRVYDKLVGMRDVIETNHRVVLPRTDGFGPDAIRHVAASSGRKDSLLQSFRRWACSSLEAGVDTWFGQPFYVEDET